MLDVPTLLVPIAVLFAHFLALLQTRLLSENLGLESAAIGRLRVLPAAPDRQIVYSAPHLGSQRKIEENTILKGQL
jgi:hypothetical protein